MMMTTGTVSGRVAGSHRTPESLAPRLSISKGSSATPAGGARRTGGAAALVQRLDLDALGRHRGVRDRARFVDGGVDLERADGDRHFARAVAAAGTTFTVASMMRLGPMIALNGVGERARP